ncbi:MAG TPA: phosphatidylserine decarboxylase [Steroidobacteraceae bacterium]|nr:phosphatidylserine decarboxylase [Steroidobacteraceae bacterium]
MTRQRSFAKHAAILLLLSLACSLAQTAASADGPATLELKRLAAADPQFKRMLVASIEQARRVNPDRTTNPAQSLEEYYEFISWAERGLPGSLVKHRADATLYQRVDQSLGYLYFICDQPLDELKGKGLFNNSLQYVEPFASWNRSFIRSWGTFLDSPHSWNEEYLRLAQADPTFGLSRGWYEDPARWKTFNEFFARKLRSPSQRPIAARADNSVVASPVDSVPQGFWAIDKSSRVIEKQGVAVKTGTVQSVEELIGSTSAYKNAFAGGTFTHLFLDLGDYHHYHFPLDGVVKELTIIPGNEAAGGYITWDATNRRYAFDPSSIGWQSLETRGSLILETGQFGLVALLPIGMSPVSSVSFDPALRVGARVRKGDRLGHFLFGGSDFVMVFQAGYTLTPDLPRDDSGRGYAHVLMGQRFGVLSRR